MKKIERLMAAQRKATVWRVGTVGVLVATVGAAVFVAATHTAQRAPEGIKDYVLPGLTPVAVKTKSVTYTGETPSQSKLSGSNADPIEKWHTRPRKQGEKQ